MLDMSQIGQKVTHEVCNERMLHVLEILQPYVQKYGLEVIPDDSSVTVRRRGVLAECLNITTPDRYFHSMAERVGTATQNIDVVN